ncbi:MAG: SDR family NAD(P)-dependent oxidoreductase [Gammaproteobacteria bacterium]|nr:SDR family NAD(P)-dependent oxidoreductase [Gammaproteobacteria bacterium]
MDILTSKCAILTGASHGIGPYIARTLASRGINLALAARSGAELEAVAESLGDTVKVLVVPTDLNDASQRQNLVIRTRQEFGRVDILINNAGLEEIIPFEEQRSEMIPSIINTNVIAPMLLTHEVLPPMLARGEGAIVNVASLAGRTGMPFGAVYSGSKGALAEWSISLHAELFGRGVSVSAVCPGFVSDEGMHARKGTPAPRSLGEVSPQAVADAVLLALETGHPEILVSSRPIRLLMALRALAPRAALAFARRSGLINYLKKLASANKKNHGD